MSLYEFYGVLQDNGIKCYYRKFNGIYAPIKKAIYAWTNITLAIKLAKENGFKTEMDSTNRVMIY